MTRFIINTLYWLKSGRTLKALKRLYSKIVCLDLDEPIGLENCLLQANGLTVEFRLPDRSYYLNGNDTGFTVTEALWKSGLVYYKQIMTEDFCLDFRWAKLLIAADLELSRRNYYAKRQRELLEQACRDFNEKSRV